MKILVLEDDANKLRNIKATLELNFPTATIDTVADLTSAREKLSANTFEIFIVDIQVPDKWGNTPLSNGGEIILKELNESDTLRMPKNIIGLTSYSESIENLNDYFRNNLYALLKYDASSNEWSERLVAAGKRIAKITHQTFSPIKSFDYDLALITALVNPELKHIKKLPISWDELPIAGDNSRYFEGTTTNKYGETLKIVAAAAPEMGMSASAALSSKIINHFRPRYLVMSGICGGFKDKVNLGDVIVAEPSWNYENGKWAEDKDGNILFQPDPRQIRLDKTVLSDLSRMSESKDLLNSIKDSFPGSKPAHDLRLQIGPMATGSSVRASEKALEMIMSQNRKSIAFEMEVYGMMLAADICQTPKPTTFGVKSVCDFGDKVKSDDYQEYAAHTSAQIIYHWAIESIRK